MKEPLRQRRHKHSFRFVSLQSYTWERGYPTTLVLWRCECGKTIEEEKKGVWTSDQLGLTKAGTR